MTKKIITYVAFFIFGILNTQALWAQCQCTNCPLALPDGAQETFNLTSSGATSDLLANNPITSVVLQFNHTYPGDLTITLTSPAGETVTLVGPTCLSSACSNDINGTFTFLPNSSGATIWDNNNSASLVTGNYRPYSGTLESLDLGTVSGNWEIHVSDDQAQDSGFFGNFVINFTNSTGIECSSSVGQVVCPTISYSQENAVDGYTNTGININSNNYCQSDAAIGLISDSAPNINTFPPNGSNDQPGYFLRIVGDTYSGSEQSMTISQPGATPPFNVSYTPVYFITGNSDFMGWYLKAGSPVTFSICDSYGDGNLPYELYDLNGTLASSGTLSFTSAGQCIDLIMTPAGTAVYSGTGVTNQGDGTAIFTPSAVSNPNSLTGTNVPIVYTWNNGAGCSGTETQTVTVWPTVTSTKVADGTCSVAAETSQDQTNYTATYAVSYTTGSGATSGTGFTFAPPSNSSGNVTFTVINPNAPASLASGCRTKTVVVPFNCVVATCAAPTGTPTITNSTCSSGCTPSGGVIAAGTLACASGSLEYSVDGGTTWVASLPSYNQTTAVSFIARCNCGATQSTATSAFTTVPGTCSNPTFTGTASCSGGLNTGAITQTATGGVGPYTYAITGGSFGATLANNTYTITVTDANDCPSIATTVVACTATPTATVSADNSDPCFCVTSPVLNTNNTVNTVGVLGDVMVITTNPINTTVVWTVAAGANTTITSGPTHIGGGVYEIDITYTDNGTGWALTATPDVANAGLGVQNGAGGTTCSYTIGSFPDLNLGACAGATVSGATPAGGTYSPTTIAAPTAGSAATTVPLTYTYDAHPAVGANPACPLTLNATANLPACPAGCAASANMQWGN